MGIPWIHLFNYMYSCLFPLDGSVGPPAPHFAYRAALNIFVFKLCTLVPVEFLGQRFNIYILYIVCLIGSPKIAHQKCGAYLHFYQLCLRVPFMYSLITTRSFFLIFNNLIGTNCCFLFFFFFCVAKTFKGFI